jgi:hypothetical protein
MRETMLGIGTITALGAAIAWSFDRSSTRVFVRMANPGSSYRQPGAALRKPD